MRVSEIFNLPQRQSELDFVDVDVATDVPVFVDPRAIRIQSGRLHDRCVALLQSFFAEVLIGLKDGKRAEVVKLLERLDEPNEVHLGLSRGRSRGRGLGGVGAVSVVDALAASRAAQTGLLSDLEDSALLVDGIGRDIISDITTNVIRSVLIDYTQEQCEYHGISTEEVYAGWIWDADRLRWKQVESFLPCVEDELLLLVPKSIVRLDLIFNPQKYYSKAIAPFHEEKEIKAGSNLVYALKSTGEKRVHKMDLIEKYGNTKAAVVKHTNEFPAALKNYKETPGMATSPPLDHNTLASKTHSLRPDFGSLLGKVRAIAPGGHGASMYHRAVGELLGAVTYPFLGNMVVEDEINEGRKRIDLTYDNLADEGFFRFIGRHYMASQMVVECKNYGKDPSNPELDQLLGRFSIHRTKFGIIACRKITDKQLFAQRCKDAALAGVGFVFYVDDDDLDRLINDYDSSDGKFPFFREQFDYLVK
jgi:hypothetical protein